jgi:hypothetical protein
MGSHNPSIIRVKDFGFAFQWLWVRVLTEPLDVYMIVNFKTCRISWGTHKPARTCTLIIKKNSFDKQSYWLKIRVESNWEYAFRDQLG